MKFSLRKNINSKAINMNDTISPSYPKKGYEQ